MRARMAVIRFFSSSKVGVQAVYSIKRTLLSAFINSAAATDIFGACAGTYDPGAADFRRPTGRTGTATARRCIPMSVSPISMPASARMVSTATGSVNCCQQTVGPAAAGMGLGHHTYFFVLTGQGHGPFHNQGTVQVFTALGGQVDTVGLQYRRHSFIHGLGRFQAAVMADGTAQNFTGAASHNQQAALRQGGIFPKVPRRPGGPGHEW